MICPKCSHEWNYKGKSSLYVTCPNCYRKIHAEPSAKIKSTRLTPEETAILDRVDKEPIPKGIEASTKLIGTSCSNMWDKFYECRDCGIKFEMFKSNRAPVICPQCESKNLIADV